MSKKKNFVGVQYIDTVRVGKRTFAFGVYGDSRVGRVPFAGLAEKNPADKENTTRGRNIAIGRALENLGKEIEKREWNKLKQKSTKIISSPLSKVEINRLKNTDEAKAKRAQRAKKKA